MGLQNLILLNLLLLTSKYNLIRDNLPRFENRQNVDI
jgi:hypothetical protein